MRNAATAESIIERSLENRVATAGKISAATTKVSSAILK